MSAYKNKRVFVTGPNGFKGKWLVRLLNRLGAEVYFFKGDVANTREVNSAVAEANPDIAFHLAAISHTKAAAENPSLAFGVNVAGTMNVVKTCADVGCPVVVASTDRVYYNDGRPDNYKETDRLCGREVYSASKACAELVAESFGGDRVAIVRSSLCIGGNDFCQDRLFPAIVESIRTGVPLAVKNPYAIRPVLHVLDALRGYLMVGERMLKNSEAGEAWNFAPREWFTVGHILRLVEDVWPEFHYSFGSRDESTREIGVVKLDSLKARERLGWADIWDNATAVKMTVHWYQAHHQGVDVTDSVIKTYESFLAFFNWKN